MNQQSLCIQGTSACSSEYLPSVGHTSSSSHTIQTWEDEAKAISFIVSTLPTLRGGRYIKEER